MNDFYIKTSQYLHDANSHITYDLIKLEIVP